MLLLLLMWLRASVPVLIPSATDTVRTPSPSTGKREVGRGWSGTKRHCAFGGDYLDCSTARVVCFSFGPSQRFFALRSRSSAPFFSRHGMSMSGIPFLPFCFICPLMPLFHGGCHGTRCLYSSPADVTPQPISFLQHYCLLPSAPSPPLPSLRLLLRQQLPPLLLLPTQQ